MNEQFALCLKRTIGSMLSVTRPSMFSLAYSDVILPSTSQHGYCELYIMLDVGVASALCGIENLVSCVQEHRAQYRI